MVIRDILKEGEPVADQQALIARLREQGIEVTQPSVSRDLKELGAIHLGGRYCIPSWERADESPFLKVLSLVLSVRTAGPNHTVIKTPKAAGPLVGVAIDDSKWEEVVASLASYSSVVVLTENKASQDLLLHRLKFFREVHDN